MGTGRLETVSDGVIAILITSNDIAGLPMITHRGACHCARVSFEVLAPAALLVDQCNCSICSMSAYLHLIVPQHRFKLLSGGDVLSSYSFNTGTAKHLFCSVCGIKSFYVPRSNPDGFSVNARCLDAGKIESIEIRGVDGKNWEAAYPVGHGQYR